MSVGGVVLVQVAAYSAGVRSPGEAFAVGAHAWWLVGVKNGIKSCIATSLAITAVRKAIDKAGPDGKPGVRVEIPTPDKAYHEWWIVPKIIPI